MGHQFKTVRNHQNSQAAEILQRIIEADASNIPWSSVDKSKLPASCFLWVENPEKKETWHLPYRMGTGGVDPDTGMYRKAGQVNTNALSAIAGALKGARSGKAMAVPAEIKKKITRLFKQYGIGEFKKEMESKEYIGRYDNDAELFNDVKHRLIDFSDLMRMVSGKIADETLKSKIVTLADMAGNVAGQLITPTAESASGEFFEESANSGQTVFLEQSIVGIKKDQWDKDNAIVKDMVILTDKSGNCSFKQGKGRKYSENAQDNVVSLLNGKKAFWDHESQSSAKESGGVRRVKELVGVYENAKRENNKVKADLRLLRVPAVIEFMDALVQLGAPGVGASINASGKSSFDESNKLEIIESITALRSVDIVSEAGSTSNLFESNQRKEEKSVGKLDGITITDITKERPDLIESLKELVLESIDAENATQSIVNKNKELQEKLDQANKALDDFRVKEASEQLKKTVEQEIAAAEIPQHGVTQIFLESLMKEPDAARRKSMIDDRKKLVSTQSGVRGLGKEKVISLSSVHEGKGDGDKTDEQVYQEALKIFGIAEVK